ncbi:MAG: T9SS type A sorting domain-containing protein, partial [Bacteroidales bacterium]|nr:T9SS type A sorting domain-containing protein [Bacteroidales bacterium]
CLKLDDDGVGEHNITVAIYPNPVNDKLNVEATEAIEQVEVFNITGAKVFSKKNYTEKAEINTANLPAGTYVIRMTTQNTTEVRRFVKK